ncbi:hypothetical protein [Limnoglobus roseus]|nr:hypothetical protein [Limnoglobus roseus]
MPVSAVVSGFAFGNRIDPRDLRLHESTDAVQLRPVTFFPWGNPNHVAEDTAGGNPEEPATAERFAPPPAALHAETVTAAGLRNTVPTTGRTVAANISDREPTMVSAIVPNVPPVLPPTEAQTNRPTADRPVAPTVDNTWPVVFVGQLPERMEQQPPADVDGAKSDSPKAVPTPPEEAPVPSLVERAIEAVLPGGTPFHGVLPLAEEWIETGVTDLLAGIEGLGEDTVGGVPLWEQATWLAGAVLVLGGVTYTVRMNRGRRQLDRAVIGTDSALARWEDKNARRTIG